MIDAYGRKLKVLRLIVTLRCNYNCIFCHREGEEGNHDVLTRSDIALVGRVAALLGIRYFKITGGEPLIRSDIVEIVRSLKQQTNGEVSMVTNGYFLSKYANRLIDAGLDRVNVSMHSLNENTYERIVGVRGLNKVIQGIKILKDSEIPVKINDVSYGILIRDNNLTLYDLKNGEYRFSETLFNISSKQSVTCDEASGAQYFLIRHGDNNITVVRE